ncbi:MAG: hypothetical protein ABL931_02345 [Usitatibacteraceae bacterium]
MRSILTKLLIALLPVLGGCIAVLPVGEFVPATADGTVHTSHCVGAKSVRYEFDGVPAWVTLDGSGSEKRPVRLTMGLILADGRVARVPSPEIRVKPLDERPEEILPLPAWERNVLRRMKTKRNRLERVTVETGPASGPLVGVKPNDGGDVMGRPMEKWFTVSIPLASPIASGYRIHLPAIEINGKLHPIAPIEFRHQYRLEFMAPLNC